MRRKARASAPESYLYRDLAQQISEAMRVGSLRVGDRIPSVRRLSKQHAVSISTAVQALRHLENQRLIEARPKSGFFVARQPQALAEPEESRPPLAARYVVTPSLQRDYIEAFSAPNAVHLGAVVPPSALFPGERLAKLLASVARRNPALTVTYSVYSPGTEELRRVIARRALDSGVRIGAGDVIVTAGCLEAIMLALRAVARPGDVIALELPPRIDAVEVFRRARDENIALAPGPLFTSTGRFRNCIRLSFAHNWNRSIEDAVARVGRIARELDKR